MQIYMPAHDMSSNYHTFMNLYYNHSFLAYMVGARGLLFSLSLFPYAIPYVCKQ